MFNNVITSNCYPDSLMKTATVDLGYYLKKQKMTSVTTKPSSEKKYWMYAPGENASKWSRCQELGIICIGWDELGNLSNFESLETCKDELKDIYNNPDSSFMNDGLAVWEFSHVMKVGDVVYAKHGLNDIIGRGVVTSDYIYDATQENFYHIRQVEWTHIGKWKLDGNIVQKTLTDISKYPDYVEKIEAMITQNKTESMKESKYSVYVNLLLNNRNLIFNGAPGTGKTYLAKQVAAQIIYEGNVPEGFVEDTAFIEQCGFVQFHPSYDYTDFVEGLRPKNDNGAIGFERKDGTFKSFCKKALTQRVFISEEEALQLFKDELKVNNGITLKSFRSETDIKVIVNEKENIAVQIASKWSCTDEHMLKYLRNKECHDNDTYTKTIGDYILENYVEKYSCSKINSPQPYIFIIDEINRGEISKIFGELFFSIDPGYRGKKGKVQTQYQNLIVDEGDQFKDGFYIPENVYIIGTMNDIDRSVECMDFAMRRRFTFKEITAEESAKNMELSDEATERMMNLNNAISEIEGLNSSFHIGAAYFKDEEDYNALWNLKLEGLLREYLRGMPDAEESLESLRKAYYLDKE